MYTKLPGHDVLLQQKVRNNYAEEAMRVSAKLQMEGHNMPTDYGPPTPIVSYDQPPTPAGSNMDEEVFDAKTGIFVKPEAESKEDLQALVCVHLLIFLKKSFTIFILFFTVFL